MAKCKNCRNLETCGVPAIGTGHYCVVLEFHPNIENERDCDEYEFMTNAERIRGMSDEELAEWIEGFYACTVLGANIHFDAEIEGSTLEWLKSEVGCV